MDDDGDDVSWRDERLGGHSVRRIKDLVGRTGGGVVAFRNNDQDLHGLTLRISMNRTWNAPQQQASTEYPPHERLRVAHESKSLSVSEEAFLPVAAQPSTDVHRGTVTLPARLSANRPDSLIDF